MNKNDGRKRKIVGVVAAGALVLSLGLGSLTSFTVDSNAATVGTTTTTTTTEAAVGRGGNAHKGHRGMMDTAALVTEGLITKAQETAITKLLATKEAERTAERERVSAMTQEERLAYFDEKQLETHTTLIEELVTKGVLSQEEVDQIQAFHNEARIATMTEKITENLATFVTDGTLTTADVDAVIAYLAAQKPQEKARPVDGEALSERVNPFDTMVTEGILTQAQADAIKGTMCLGHKGGRMSDRIIGGKGRR